MITTAKIREIATTCGGSRAATLNWLADLLDAEGVNEKEARFIADEAPVADDENSE